MNQVVKFPDMRPANPNAPIPPIPTPAEYRRTVPAFGSNDLSVGTRRKERKRLMLWFGIAAGLHAALLVTLWLTPPLRLKWSPSPSDWVQVVSVPKPAPVVPAPAWVPPKSTAPSPDTALDDPANAHKPPRHASKPATEPPRSLD